ncbi:MAG TPA: hypothetical protein ENI76_02600 [Ignavibacteria bacterium]|nr:hypothetical protein [Ignavibacteria bacterium]
MDKETIKRFWRFVYSNSNEFPFGSKKEMNPFCNLCVKEKNCEWDAKKIFWRFYWVTNLTK